MFCFTFGLWLVHTAWQQQPWIAILLLGVCGAAGVFWQWRQGDSSGLLLALVVLAGCFRILPIETERRHAIAIANTLDSAPRLVQGRIAGSETLDTSRSYLVLDNVTMTSGTAAIALPGRVKLSLNESGDSGSFAAQLVRGAQVQAFAVLHEPQTLHNFFGRSSRPALALQRIYYSATVRASGLIQVVRDAHGFADRIRRLLANLRERAQQVVFAAMPEHAAKLMVCMLFNDMSQLTEDDARIFRDSGTMHLFAVSGMHVAIFALILNTLFRTFRCLPRLSWILVLAVLFLYLVLLDFLAPATRAFLMVLACTLGRITGREIDSLSSLAFGVFSILIVDPLAPWQVGFQLSVMGVVAILLVVPLFKLWTHPHREFIEMTWRDRLLQYALEAVNITLAVTLTILPLQLFYFQQYNLVSPLANMLEAVLAGPVLAAAVLVIAFGVISSSLAAVAGSAAGMIMNYVFEIARWTADAGWAIVHVPQFPALIILVYYLVLFSGYYMVFRDTPEFRYKARSRLVLHGASCVCLMVGTSWWGERHQPLRIWFFDVGQGDSTLIQFPNGQAVLVDAGTNMPDMGRMVVVPQLKALGLAALDYVVATHPDTDHTGGIPEVLRQYKVNYLVEPDEEQAGKDEIIRQVHELCVAKAITEFQPSAGDLEKVCDGCSLEVLNPPRDPAARLPLKDNNRAVVLRITYGKFSALLMADAESPVEQRLVHENIGKATILKVGHHGSRTSSSSEFLAAVHPEVALISCGLHNRYGHPNEAVLNRLQQTGARIVRTDIDGALLIETDGESYTYRTAVQDAPEAH